VLTESRQAGGALAGDHVQATRHVRLAFVRVVDEETPAAQVGQVMRDHMLTQRNTQRDQRVLDRRGSQPLLTKPVV